MTENEAKEWLTELKDCEETQEFYYADCVKEAFDVAIKTLEEIQQYRAIGTVRQVQDFIADWRKYKEFGTLEDIQTMKDNASFSGVELAQIAAMQMRLKDYEAIGTVEEFKALKEKSEPKKDNNDSGRCKYCGTYNNFIINKLANPKGHSVIHCWNCGQAINLQ